MRDGGNGAQESSLGWELSHGALDPSPCGGVPAFRGLPPLSLILYLHVYFSVLSQSILGHSSCFCFSVLTLTAVAFSIAQHANRATEFEAGVRRDIYSYLT